MDITSNFQAVYEHIAGKVKSVSVWLLILASLLTNWDLFYFLATSEYSSRETIALAVDTYFNPWMLIFVYVGLSLTVPIILIVSKALYNWVNIPLERVFNSKINGYVYPTREEYKEIVQKYEILERSFKSGDLYAELTSEVDELELKIQEKDKEISALNEIIDKFKVEFEEQNSKKSDTAISSKAPRQYFIDDLHFGSENEKIANIIVEILFFKVKADKFSVDDLIDKYQPELKTKREQVKLILERWVEEGLLAEDLPSISIHQTRYQLSRTSRELIFQNELVDEAI